MRLLDAADKSNWLWTAMIRVPDAVTEPVAVLCAIIRRPFTVV